MFIIGFEWFGFQLCFEFFWGVGGNKVKKIYGNQDRKLFVCYVVIYLCLRCWYNQGFVYE